MRDNLLGSVEQLKGSLESLGIKVGTLLIPPIRKGVNWLSKFVDKFNILPDFIKKA